MDTLQYVKARKKLKCTYKPKRRDANYQHELGRILEKTGEREKMEIDKEELITPPSQNLDFIY